MPELPEVETTVIGLKKKIIGLKIIDSWSDTPSIVKKPSFVFFKKNIKQRRIKNVLRKGKNIIFRLDNDRAILIHQKMTGHLLYGKWRLINKKWIPERKGFLNDPMNRFLRLIFFLSNGDMLALCDLRKFAKVIFGKEDEINNLPEIKKLGQDALKITFKEFKKIIKKKNIRIKQFLMDQELISGIGNIYSDEILFEAKINPFERAQKIKEKDLKNIFQAMKKVLKISIKLQGESISDYRTPEGRKGNFDKERKVYRREGEKCRRCSSKITRRKIGSRSTYFCPTCQKLKNEQI